MEMEIQRMTTLILFLSQLHANAKEEEYQTDLDFSIKGIQTNEAPTKYAIKRLHSGGKKLDRIIAFVTLEAENSAFAHYLNTIEAYCKKEKIHCPVIQSVRIPDSVEISELLQKLIDSVFPFDEKDSIIIETTGGYRNAIHAFTLFARFLHYLNIRTEFSTFSDYQKKTVTTTNDHGYTWRGCFCRFQPA